MKTIEIPSNVMNQNNNLSDDWKECCRICHSEEGRLLRVCKCKGSLAFVHENCQLDWLEVKGSKDCEICSTKLKVKKVYKSFSDWITIKENHLFRVYLCLDIICAVILVSALIWSFDSLIGILRTKELLASIIVFISVVQLMVMLALWTFKCLAHHMWSYDDWRQNHYKIILKQIKIKGEVNGSNTGILGHNRLTSFWRSLFCCSKSSAQIANNLPQINQI